MTRDDYLEIAIRVLGLYAWLQAAFAGINAIASIPTVLYTLAASPEPHPELTPLSGLVGALAFSTIKCAVLFFIGRYLITDGQWILQKVRKLSRFSSGEPAV